MIVSYITGMFPIFFYIFYMSSLFPSSTLILLIFPLFWRHCKLKESSDLYPIIDKFIDKWVKLAIPFILSISYFLHLQNGDNTF